MISIKIFLTKLSYVALICLLLYAGITKLMDYNNFIIQLDLSPLIPDKLVQVIAISLPCVEIFLAVGLCLNKTRKTSSLIAFTLMFTFTIYLLTLVIFFDDVPCSCGGVLGKISYTTHIIFNTLFTIIAGFTYIISNETS